MTELSAQAIQVRDALIAKGIETPMSSALPMSAQNKKEKIEYICVRF